jgi:hypothetical protein
MSLQTSNSLDVEIKHMQCNINIENIENYSEDQNKIKSFIPHKAS